jgi:hypothetical protein
MQLPEPSQWSTVQLFPSEWHPTLDAEFDVVHVPGDVPLHVAPNWHSGAEQLGALQQTPSTQLPEKQQAAAPSAAHSGKPAEHAAPFGL